MPLALVDAYGLVLQHALAGPLVAHVLKTDEDSHVPCPFVAVTLPL